MHIAQILEDLPAADCSMHNGAFLKKVDSLTQPAERFYYIGKVVELSYEIKNDSKAMP